MLKSDRERLKKMILLWERLTAQIGEHQITKESLMEPFISTVKTLI